MTGEITLARCASCGATNRVPVSAVRAGKQENLTCDIEVGHRSSSLPLISNISYRVGRELKWDGKKEQFVNDKEANKLLKRDYRKGYVVPTLGGNGTA